MSELSKVHEEFMAMSAAELNIWIEEAQVEDLLNPANLEECPWILIPSILGKNLPPLNSTGSETTVPIKWSMGDVSWYIVEYDGNDTVNAYISDSDGISPTKTKFNISKLSDLTLHSENETWRVYRDVHWNPNTKLSDIIKTFSKSSFVSADDDEDLVF